MRKLENSTNISSEDKALFRAICETYEPSEIERYFKELQLNEGHFFSVTDPEHYAKTTPGTTEKGIKGLVKAAPSAVIACVVCAPAAMIAALGAVRTRFEKQFTKSLLNQDRWLDFIGTSKEKKQQLVDKVKREVAVKTRYFMAKLANGEIIRVVASHTYEAKQMALAIEEELIINQEKEFTLLKDPDPGVKYESKSRDNTNDKLYLVTFTDGEVLYWQADKSASKESIVKEANKQRKFIADGFAKKFKKITGKNLQGIGNSYDKEYEPIVAAIVENVEVIDDPTQYKKITDYNKETIEIIEGDKISSRIRQNDNLLYYTLKSDVFRFDSSNGDKQQSKYSIVECSLPTANSDEMSDEVSVFFTKNDKYYSSTFINNLQQYLKKIDADYPIYIGQFSFGNKCTILLPYQDKLVPANLVKDLSKNFEAFLTSNEELDSNTKNRINKYVYNQKIKNAIQVNPLKNKLFRLPKELFNETKFIEEYKTTFTNNVKMEVPDEDGNMTTTPVNLNAVA